jgi:hypothetical protein
MGAECSADRNIHTTIGDDYSDQKDSKYQNDEGIVNCFDFKNYKEYSNRMDLFKMKLKEIITNVELTNGFSIKMQ